MLALVVTTSQIEAVPVVSATDEMARQDRRYNIRDFGAIGDGVAMDTEAVQTAIDTSHATGGGVAGCRREISKSARSS